MNRTDFNGNLRAADEGKHVELVGWVANRRNLGSLLFIDLRDYSGIVQLVSSSPDSLPEIKNEYVIGVKGIVRKKEVPNKNLATGEIEVEITELRVINKSMPTPFIIADKSDALEETRLPYRYLDLRRPVLLNNLKTRAKIVKIWHEYLDSKGFIEVETPILNLSSPEGARDYLVPSRVHPGSFYALPQSPQLWKQLLMVGGIERYYQVAKCFRDEDLRADRQPEFTQLDLEVSFMSQDEILSLQEGFLARIFKEIVGYDVQLPLRRMKYWDAMDIYGSDKPDTRYGLTLVDITEIMKKSTFEGFAEAKYIKAIVVPNMASQTSRKNVDEVVAEGKKFKLKGVTALKYLNNTLEGSFTKFLNEEIIAELIKKLNLSDNDLVLFSSSSSRRDIDFGLGAIRTMYAKKLELIKKGTYDLLWVIDFPMFDLVDEEKGIYAAEHHPFTRPRDEDLHLLDTNPEEVLAYAYDIIINGYEAGGGTLRIYDHDTQWKIFKLLGLSDEDVERKFGWFINAFNYGAPPHGGIAFGLDRLAMILVGSDNIKDVEAFPKNLQASDPMSKAPTPVDQDQLDVLNIQVKQES
ncbi:MAG: aspartate--tRNA ligase [Bacilli bacterium]|nr:aspartate--tRNA ligase [Bacilli bacterium]MDY6430649.1 aspartate--tRNA ligase [Bacilli bacterium]